MPVLSTYGTNISRSNQVSLSSSGLSFDNLSVAERQDFTEENGIHHDNEWIDVDNCSAEECLFSPDEDNEEYFEDVDFLSSKEIESRNEEYSDYLSWLYGQYAVYMENEEPQEPNPPGGSTHQKRLASDWIRRQKDDYYSKK